MLKKDILVTKNYLTENELKALERIVAMYLDYAENLAARQIPMKMKDWVEKLDAFLKFNEYENFRVHQDNSFESDFEKVAKKLKEKSKL